MLSFMEKFEIRKKSYENMGGRETQKENPTFSNEKEKALYEYNINLEDANEDVISKGRVHLFWK